MNCPGVTAAAQLDRRDASISSVCSIITTASAPRGITPPVAMVVAVPGFTSTLGAWPQAITSALSASCFGAPSLAPADVGGAQRKAVDIGAVERRHVDRRHHVMREHARQRRTAARRSPGSGDRSSRRSEERASCLLGGNDFEELLLPRGLPPGGRSKIVGRRG